MPKLIENLRENIVQCAKKELLEHGYDALAIRGVAKVCGIAVGTVYNYFPSKDVLAAAVMLEDWLVETERMQRACAAADSLPAALRALYEGVAAFSSVYRSVWSGYTYSDGFRSAFGKRHQMLVRQLAGCIGPVLSRFAPDSPAGTDVFLAENVLVCAGESEMTFDLFLHIVQRILP